MSGSVLGPLRSGPSIQFVVFAPHNAAGSLPLSAPNKPTLLGGHIGECLADGNGEGRREEGKLCF